MECVASRDESFKLPAIPVLDDIAFTCDGLVEHAGSSDYRVTRVDCASLHGRRRCEIGRLFRKSGGQNCKTGANCQDSGCSPYSGSKINQPEMTQSNFDEQEEKQPHSWE